MHGHKIDLKKKYSGGIPRSGNFLQYFIIHAYFVHMPINNKIGLINIKMLSMIIYNLK